MGHYVHIHVSFACGNYNRPARLAREWLPRLKGRCVNERDMDWDVECFLTELGKRSGELRGPKGGVALWGHVGNHTDGERFVRTLEGFWRELLLNDPGSDEAPFDFERIVVFIEDQNEENAEAWVVSLHLDPDNVEVPGPTTPVRFEHHHLPFGWNQT